MNKFLRFALIYMALVFTMLGGIGGIAVYSIFIHHLFGLDWAIMIIIIVSFISAIVAAFIASRKRECERD